MSHSVTVTRTTTSSGNSSYIVINTGYFKTLPGLFKLLELILGIICVGLVGYYFDYSHSNIFNSRVLERDYVLFYLLMTTTFMIGTFLIVLSCLISLGTGTIMSKTIFEPVYHFFAGIMLLIVGLIVVSTINSYRVPKDMYNCHLTAGILAIANAILYFISTFLAHRSYKGM